jgi:mannose-1-phosphate guanylyltransferase
MAQAFSVTTDSLRNRNENLTQPNLTLAVVIAGGAGTRLLPTTQSLPKPLVRVGGKPLLEWIMLWLKKNGMKEVVIGVAYQEEKIRNYFRDGHELGLRLRYSEHTVEGGTGEAFRLAISRNVDNSDFFALNCDQLTDLNLQKLALFHMRHQPTVTMAVNHPRLPFGEIRMTRNHVIRAFLNKPIARSYCSMGIYVFNKSILNLLPRKGDIETTTFPSLAANGKLRGYPFNGLFVTVNTAYDLQRARDAINTYRRTLNR